MQSYPYIALSDGTTTVTFQDGLGGATNYPLVFDTWAPEIAARRDNVLGGRLQYADVVETISINVRDVTAEGCYQRLATLAQLIEQADRYWRLGQPVAPVLFKYAPQGSNLATTAAPYQAMVLGRAKGDQTSGVKLSAVYNRVGMLYEILDVQVAFLRRGVFTLGASSVSSASGATGDERLATFATSIAVPSAVDVQIGGIPNTAGTFTGWRQSVLLTGKASTDLSILEAETGAAGAWTSVADAANKPSGNVLRYTPVGTAADKSGAIGGTISVSSVRLERAVIVAMVRNNSGATSFQLRATVKIGNQFVSSTPYQVIDTTNYAAPTPIILGQVTWKGAWSAARLYLECIASAAAGTLDIDIVVFQCVRGEENGAIALAAVSTTGFVSNAVQISMSPTASAAPAVDTLLDGTTTPLTYSGALPFYASGTTMYLCWLVGNATYWRLTDGAAALATVQFNLIRYDSYLVPQ